MIGLAEDCKMVDIKHFNVSLSMSHKGWIKLMSKTHGWDKKSPDCAKPSKDVETKGHLVSCLPVDCLICIHKEEAFKEGTVEHIILKEKMGFQCAGVLGELMHAMVTVRPDVAHLVMPPSKFSSAPSECHCQTLEGLRKHL